MNISFKNMLNLGFVAKNLKSPSKYPDLSNGFLKDRINLSNDMRSVAGDMNKAIRKYGIQKYTD